MTSLRLALAVAGFGVALLAIAYEQHLLGWLAIGLLAGSAGIRVWQRRQVRSSPPGGAE